MKTSFQCITLRGGHADRGIDPKQLEEFTPVRWGFTRNPQPLAVVDGDDEELTTVNVKIIDGLPYVTETETDKGEPQKDLVLLQEYSTGVGGKRWPGFRVSESSIENILVLSSYGTNKGSGWERHTLLVAPLGWAENIASQFVNIRDIGDQIIDFSEEI